MNELVTKEIEFYGGKIVSIIENKKIYVSVKSVCENLGMDKTQTRTQRAKLQNDEFLKGGLKFTPLSTNGGKQEVLVIELDYLPIWLAKINPARFDESLKQKLMIYQLRAKDVLAEAFLGKRELVNKDYIRKMDYDRAIVFIRAMMNNLKSNLLFEKTEMEQRIKELDRTGLTSKMEVYIDDGEIKILQDAD